MSNFDPNRKDAAPRKPDAHEQVFSELGGGEHGPDRESVDPLAEFKQLITASDHGLLERMYDQTFSTIIPLAFPASAGRVRTHVFEGVAVITDSAECDIERAGRHFAAVRRMTIDPLPGFIVRDVDVPVVIFHKHGDYHAFVERYAQHYGLDYKPVEHESNSGFNFEGMATATWDSAQGMRPVLTHEFIHATVQRLSLILRMGDWFQEGLATLGQVMIHKH